MANETVYRVMNHAEVVTLKEMVMKNGKLTYEKLCRYLCPVMKDLSKIHEKGIIHGAICPDNIMVNADGEVHLLDLGVAKDLYQSEETQKEDSDDVLSAVRKRPADTDGSSGFRKRKNGSKCNK